MNPNPPFQRRRLQSLQDVNCESLADSSPRESAYAESSCRFVTFYEDMEGAARVREAFDTLAQTLSPDHPIDSAAWSFSALTRPQLNADVFRDIAHADVLVIASRNDRPLPSCAQDRIEKSIRETVVLVALHDPAVPLDGKPGSLLSSLEPIARRKGATFVTFDALRQRVKHGQAEPNKEHPY